MVYEKDYIQNPERYKKVCLYLNNVKYSIAILQLQNTLTLIKGENT